MDLIIAVKNRRIAKQLEFTLKRNHSVLAVCKKTQELVDLVELTRPDMVIMEIDLSGKFTVEDLTKYINEVFKIPVVFIITTSSTVMLNKALQLNPYGILTDPGDVWQVDFILELAYNKFTERSC